MLWCSLIARYTGNRGLALLPQPILHYNLGVPTSVSRLRKLALLLMSFPSAVSIEAQDQPPPPSAARILLLPRKIVSGERATLAVLDVSGRLTPGVTVEFSNGDQLKTDPTGRGLFVAPLNSEKLYASIEGRPGRVSTTVLTATESPVSALEVALVTRYISLSDRLEITGHGFCGDADANHVTFDNKPGFVLAASPAYLAVFPPADMNPGPAQVQVTCGQKSYQSFIVVLIELGLEASSAPLSPGEHRTLTVRVKGTPGKLTLEARNLAPDIAEVQGGPSVRAISTGGTDNTATFELIGKKHGNFVISIRLVSPPTPPRH